VTLTPHRTLRLAALLTAAACGAADRPPTTDGVAPADGSPVVADEGAALAEATATTVAVATTVPATGLPDTVAPVVAAELDAVVTAVDQELATLEAELAELDALLTE
jgi:hypothetical protein